MKKISILITLLFITTSCDSPRSQRSIVSSKSNGLGNGDSSGLDWGEPRSGSLTNSGIPDVKVDPKDSIVPADAKHCKFSSDGVNDFASTSSHLGSYTLCQSSTDKSVFYAQVKTPPVGPNGDVSICFIPQTTSGTDSIYVGNPMCGTFTDSKAVKKITFVKYNQYTNASINNVLFFKDTYYFYPMYGKNVMTLDAYKDCMHRLSQVPKNVNFCNSFKSVAQYVIQSF